MKTTVALRKTRTHWETDPYRDEPNDVRYFTVSMFDEIFVVPRALKLAWVVIDSHLPQVVLADDPHITLVWHAPHDGPVVHIARPDKPSVSIISQGLASFLKKHGTSSAASRCSEAVLWIEYETGGA